MTEPNADQEPSLLVEKKRASDPSLRPGEEGYTTDLVLAQGTAKMLHDSNLTPSPLSLEAIVNENTIPGIDGNVHIDQNVASLIQTNKLDAGEKVYAQIPLETEFDQKFEVPNIYGMKRRIWELVHEILGENGINLSNQIDINTLNNDAVVMAILYGDINGLKFANDLKGHNFGDTLIRAFVKAMKSTFRKEDCIARLHEGDEFGVLMELSSLSPTQFNELMVGSTDHETHKYVPGKLSQLFHHLDEIRLKSIQPFANVALDKQKGDQINTFANQSDERLYEAVNNGIGTVSVGIQPFTLRGIVRSLQNIYMDENIPNYKRPESLMDELLKNPDESMFHAKTLSHSQGVNVAVMPGITADGKMKEGLDYLVGQKTELALE